MELNDYTGIDTSVQKSLLRAGEIPLDEEARMAALDRCRLLNTPPEEAFDRVARLAARLLGAPVALVTLVEPHRQFFKSAIGLEAFLNGSQGDVRETPLSHSFCQYVVAKGAPFVVEDAAEHPLVRENLARGEFGVEAYLGIPFRDPGGEVLGTLCVMDREPRSWSEEAERELGELAITLTGELERREAMRQREESKRDHAALQALTEASFNAISDIFFILDLDGNLLRWNGRMSEVTGRTEEELAEMPAVEFFPEEDRPAVADTIARVYEEGHGAVEAELLTPEGRMPYELNGRPLHDDEGHVVGLCGTARDISERIRAEEVLRESEQFLRSTINALSAHVAVLDEEGTIVATNEAWRAFGEANDAPPEAIGVGANYFDACEGGGEEGRDVAGGIRDVLARQRQTYSLEYPCHSPTEQRWFVLHARRFGGEQAPRVVVSHEDITEMKQSEAKLLRREALLQGTAEAVGHLLTGDLDDVVGEALKALGTATDADRAYVFEKHEDPNTGRPLVSQRYEWVRGDVEAQIDNPDLQNIPGDEPGFAWLYQELLAGRHVAGPVWEMPTPERQQLEEQGIKSLIAVPIRTEGRLWGAMGFDDCRTERVWSAAEKATLMAAASSIGETILRQRNQAALEASEEKYRSVVESVHDVVFQTDAEGRWTYISPSWARLVGYLPGESLGDKFFDYIHPDEREEVTHAFRALINGEQEWAYAVGRRFLARDGSRQWVEVHAAPRFNENGRIIGVAGTLHDITERRRAEHELRESEGRLRLALEAGRMGTWDYDLQTGEVVWSARVYDLFDVSRDAVGDQPPGLLNLIHEDDRDRITAEMEAAGERATTSRESVHIEHEFRVRRQEEIRWIRTIGRVCVDGNGQPDRVLGTILDVTDEKAHAAALVEAKERAEEMSQLKSAFLANMSHEIRTPLTGILGFADLLAEEAPPKMREGIEQIQASGQRLMDTLTSVLDLAQIESGTMTLQTQPVPVVERVNRACAPFRVQAQVKGIWLDVVAPDASLTVEADRRALDRVLDNLLSNAVKFTAEGGVTVAVSATDEHVEVTVSDTGVGIGEAARDRLFDAFYQESSGLDREYEGCGLGLAITKQLVDTMEGEIELASQRESGTTFRLRLPRAADDPAAHVGQTPGGAQPSLPVPEQDSEASQRPSRRSARRSVLVVEDNAATSHFIQRVLEGQHEATFAATASKALALARQATFDIVLLDINLGSGQSGEDVLHELRRMSAYRQTPIVAVTAHALPDDEARFLKTGFDGYLSKPFTARHLEQVLETVEPVRSSRSGSEGSAVHEGREGLPLENLLKTCRTHELIDGYEWSGGHVTLTIDIASFRLTPEDARVVLLNRLRQRGTG